MQKKKKEKSLKRLFSSEPGSNMTLMLEISDKEFKIMIINMLMALNEKVYCM